MSIETFLFVLRVLSGLVLIAFLFAIFIMMWREYRGTVALVNASRRTYGQLIGLVEADGKYVPTGETFPLLPLTSLGRSPTNTITINDSFASAEHALVFLRGGQWWLEDRRSRNGTRLNSEDIANPVIVTDGDIISIGNMSFRIELER